LIEYIGPPVIYRLFSDSHVWAYEIILGTEYIQENREIFLYQFTHLDMTQIIAKYMIYLYFGKRILECICLHRLSQRTCSINQLIWRILFYWFGLGLVAFTLFHLDKSQVFFRSPDPQNPDHPRYLYAAMVLFVILQFCNFHCHKEFAEKETALVNDKSVLPYIDSK